MRIYSEDHLKEIFKNVLDERNYTLVCNLMEDAPVIEAIPIIFMEEFVKTHDPVYKNNIRNLIKSYREAIYGKK